MLSGNCLECKVLKFEIDNVGILCSAAISRIPCLVVVCSYCFLILPFFSLFRGLGGRELWADVHPRSWDQSLRGEAFAVLGKWSKEMERKNESSGGAFQCVSIKPPSKEQGSIQYISIHLELIWISWLPCQIKSFYTYTRHTAWSTHIGSIGFRQSHGQYELQSKAVELWVSPAHCCLLSLWTSQFCVSVQSHSNSLILLKRTP